MPSLYCDVSQRALAAAIRRDGRRRAGGTVTAAGIPAYIQGSQPVACLSWKAEKDDCRFKPTRSLRTASFCRHNIDHPGVVSRTLWREVSLLTCREQANGEGLDALVQLATGMTASSAAVPAAGKSLADNAR
jgi:hypothetical protein